VRRERHENAYRGPVLGTAFVHTVLDDHSRVAYAEIHDDETAATAIGVLRRAVAWVRAPRRHRAAGALGQRLGLPLPRLARRMHGAGHQAQVDPALPAETNGKIERFHRTLADGWAFARMFLSESARRKALPSRLHEYNHHRPHTAIGNRPPITRLTNLSGQYT
jgi:transposase InsO family protein